jgi:transposase-like protein
MSTSTTTSTARALAHAEGVPDPEIPEKVSRRRFSAKYKLAILDEYDHLSEPGAKGALLRREGLYSSHLVEWRKARDAGALAELGRARGRKPRRSSEGVELERMQRRAERAEAELAKARLVIEVQGKVSALLEAISESAEPETKSKP